LATPKVEQKIELLLAELDNSDCLVEHLDHRMAANLFTPRLRKKYRAARAQVASVDDFIDLVASRSSVTKTSYQYICGNKHPRDLGGFLHETAAHYERQQWQQNSEDN